MKSKQELKKVFENGDKPKQEDFWEWQDSYWHKEEDIPIEQIEELENSLDSKANVDATNVTNTEAWRYALNLYSKSEIDDELSQIETEIVTERNINTNQDEIIQNLETTINELNSWKSQLTDVDTDNIVNTLTELLATFQSIPEGTDIYKLINSKINSTDIVNNLTSLSTTNVLSANQGKVLKDLIDTISINQQNTSLQSVLNAGSEALVHYGAQKFSLTSESGRALQFNKSEDEVFELNNDAQDKLTLDNFGLKYSGQGDNIQMNLHNGTISLKGFNNSQLVVDQGGSYIQTGESFYKTKYSDLISYGSATNVMLGENLVSIGVGDGINPDSYSVYDAYSYLRLVSGEAELSTVGAMNLSYGNVFYIRSTNPNANSMHYSLLAHDNGFIRIPNNTYENIATIEGYEPKGELAASVDYVDKTNSYSNDELKIGSTWTNGKHVYRKVLNLDWTQFNNISLLDLIPNIEEYIKVDSMLVHDGNKYIGPIFIGVSDLAMAVQIYNIGEPVKLVYWSPINDRYEQIDVSTIIGHETIILNLIVEYTKTTD